MKRYRTILLLILASVTGMISCKDESLSPYISPEGNAHAFGQFVSKVDGATLVPTGSAFYAQGDVDRVTYFDAALTTPNQVVNFQLQWLAIDDRVRITEIELYLEYDEIYSDAERNPKTAKHGGTSATPTVPDGKFWKTIPAGEQRTPISIPISGSDIYEVFKDNTFNYGDGAVNIFTAHPYNASFDRSLADGRFKNTRTYTVPGKGTVSLAADVFRIRWRLIAEDGTAYGSWSPSTCTSVVGANCNGGWKVNANVFNPTTTFSMRGQWGAVVSGVRQRPVIGLKAGARDTVNIVFNREINVANPPVVAASAATAAWANIGTPVAYDNKDAIANNSYYVPVEATAVGTGNLSLIVTGAVSAKGDAMVANGTTNVTSLVAVDNTAPQGTRAWSTARVGRGQASTVTVTFNEALSAAAKDSIYVSISGQGIDPVVDRRMILAANGLSASYIYLYKDSSSPTDVTSGGLTITYGGGKDVAGNPLDLATIASGGLSTDVSALDAVSKAVITAAPTAPTLTLAAPYDLGTQIKWTFAVSGPGSTTGTVFYLLLKSGTTPPGTFQRYLDVQGVAVYNGFDLQGTAAADIVAQGSIAATSGTTGTVFTPLAPNGTFDVYAYWVTNTGNSSPVSGILGTITMN